VPILVWDSRNPCGPVSERCGQLHKEHSGAAARLTSLYEAHATDAFRYALHLTGRREDAEDVVQFVFLRAYGMLESGTELVNPRAWLIKATKHRSLNLIRDRREAPMVDTEIAVGPQYDPDPAEAEALTEVRSTLWALPESQHHAFVLRHWSGLSQDEIADVLGTTPGAVESLLVRARTTLLEDRQQGEECAGVRRRLVQALAPTGAHEAHIRSCRRCRTAQTRLLRASEFATAFALVPRPYVAHALASVVPGFGAPAAAATTATTGAASAGAGGGTGMATAAATTKVALAAKIALATVTAVVAVSAAHPVRSAVERAVLGAPAAGSTAAAHPVAPAASHGPATGARAGEPAPGVASAGRSSHGKPSAHPSHGQSGKGKAKGRPAAAGGNGKAKGKPATAGSNGKTKGQPATAGSNGKATGRSATPGSNGKATGKPATGSSGKAKGKPTSTGTTTTGGSSTSSGHGNGKGNGNG
jgi:RNA polymerase sigma factor (sigma-70 family)